MQWPLICSIHPASSCTSATPCMCMFPQESPLTCAVCMLHRIAFRRAHLSSGLRRGQAQQQWQPAWSKLIALFQSSWGVEACSNPTGHEANQHSTCLRNHASWPTLTFTLSYLLLLQPPAHHQQIHNPSAHPQVNYPTGVLHLRLLTSGMHHATHAASDPTLATQALHRPADQCAAVTGSALQDGWALGANALPAHVM